MIRRRRQCLTCKRRFTTRERIEDAVKLMVVKKDGARVPFDREKIVAGVSKACYKRPVSAQAIHDLAQEIEDDLLSRSQPEVPSQAIGNLVMSKLRRLDQVAYVRYASVYREFQDLGQFIDEVQEVLQHQDEPSDQETLF